MGTNITRLYFFFLYFFILINNSKSTNKLVNKGLNRDEKTTKRVREKNRDGWSNTLYFLFFPF